MSDNRKEAEEKMAKAIFISNDCWLCVFDLITPSQLGFGIAMISHRFDIYVDEHFKTRKRTLALIRIRSKIGENGTKEMEIVNSRWKPLPIPQIQMPRKVIGFEWINISFIDRNVITFLHHFRQLFAVCPIFVAMDSSKSYIFDMLVTHIWSLLGKNIHGLRSPAPYFHRLRKFAPSFLDDCPSLRFFNLFHDGFFAEFPCDDSAAASDGQALAKWLFTPRPDGVPKAFKCTLHLVLEKWASKIEPLKKTFASASSPVNFIVSIWIRPTSVDTSVVPFVLTNELTREQLALKRTYTGSYRFLLVRHPIARDESKWTKWEEEAIEWKCFDQWNKIDIRVHRDEQIGDGLFDANPGPSDQLQQLMNDLLRND